MIKKDERVAAADVLTIFPPLTEARFFPYLSLPMITAYLRKKGFAAEQADLNIKLCHTLSRGSSFERYLELRSGSVPENLADSFRREYASYLCAEADRYGALVFDKKPGHASPEEAVRHLRQGVELLLEGSLLKKEFHSIAEMAAEIEAGVELPTADLAAVQMKQSCEAILALHRPKIIALSVAYYSQLFPAMLIAAWSKRLLPDAVVILGGQQIMMRHQEISRVTSLSRAIDCLGCGPGEQTLELLIEHLGGRLSREGVPDIRWLGKNGAPAPRSTVHIKDLSEPDFDGLDVNGYLNARVELPILTSVGCYWARCVFCSYGNRSKKESPYQQAPAEIAADWCERILAKHGADHLIFADESANLMVVRSIMRILAGRGRRIRFNVRNRFEVLLLDKAFCAELAELGCSVMSCGYETISQRLLDKMDKGVCASDVQEIVENLDEAGIALRLSVMGGILDETEAEERESLAFLMKNAHKIGIDTMQMLILEPGTFLADDPTRYGLTASESGIGELRGNELLSYGMGRMGASFEYAGGGNFKERQERFLRIHREVLPHKNAELPPAQRPRAAEGMITARPVGIDLAPWVKVLPALDEGAPVLVDMLWQRFFGAPEWFTPADGRFRMRVGSRGGERAYLGSLARLGMGTLVFQEASHG